MYIIFSIFEYLDMNLWNWTNGFELELQNGIHGLGIGLMELENLMFKFCVHEFGLGLTVLDLWIRTLTY